MEDRDEAASGLGENPNTPTPQGDSESGATKQPEAPAEDAKSAE